MWLRFFGLSRVLYERVVEAFFGADDDFTGIICYLCSLKLSLTFI